MASSSARRQLVKSICPRPSREPLEPSALAGLWRTGRNGLVCAHLPPAAPILARAPEARWNRGCRLYTTQTQSKSSSSTKRKPEAFVSTSDDPYFNLALEDHLFRSRSTPPLSSKQRALNQQRARQAGQAAAATPTTEEEAAKQEDAPPLVLLYRNRTCVVIGRNQNPWKEVNAAAMRDAGIPIVRRRSGGGTVYHDIGNTNYSIHVPRDSFDRSTNAHLIARALNSPPIGLASAPSSSPTEAPDRTRLAASHGVYVNERNDICVELVHTSSSKAQSPLHAALQRENESKTSSRPPFERKVSGSAYKLVSSRAYHHGTMLLSSDLASLGASLRNERGDHLSTKGIASVRASVVNLQEAFPSRREALNHDVFCKAVVSEFLRTYGPSEDAEAVEEAEPRIQYVGEEWLDSEPQLRKGYEELISWDWTYAQTPEFTHHLSTARNAVSGVPFEWGDFELTLQARQGIIQSAELSNVEASSEAEGTEHLRQALQELVDSMQGQRYDDYALRPPGKLTAHNPEDSALQALSNRLGDRANTTSGKIQRDAVTWLKHVL